MGCGHLDLLEQAVNSRTRGKLEQAKETGPAPFTRTTLSRFD
jgi:hypothetical protein